ncbi:unnamed protein product [Clonostachys byssicola]|uniref:Uncharacterized protein n=1 Tax=Clonostachys byssicola TaxID=160290 RepID=A0A9N9U0T7_9HYPO|nr:unnamed protein product [Clonostachys byssicola]
MSAVGVRVSGCGLVDGMDPDKIRSRGSGLVTGIIEGTFWGRGAADAIGCRCGPSLWGLQVPRTCSSAHPTMASLPVDCQGAAIWAIEIGAKRARVRRARGFKVVRRPQQITPFLCLLKQSQKIS